MMISFLDQTMVNVLGFIMMWFMYPYIFNLIISNFNMTKYHKKIQEFLFYWYIIEALSGRPWTEIKNLVDQKKTSAWSMRKRVKNGLTLKIQTETEARIAAKKLFKKVAKPRSEFIELEELTRFLPKIDALATLRILTGISKGDFEFLPHSEEASECDKTQISCSSLQQWMVYAFRLEISLVLSMKDTDSIIKRMSIKVYLVLVVSLAISLVPVMLGGCGYILYLFIISLASLAAKTFIESSSFHDPIMLFFFLIRFDVGERCVIDKVELVVKKINFFSTTFVGLDKKEYVFSSDTLKRKCIERSLGSSRLDKIHLILS